MLTDRIVYFDGDYVAWNQATVHIMCHSIGRGSAIFEVLGLHNTETGPAVFRLHDHLTRLFRTAELLDMELPLSKEKLIEAVTTTVRKNSLNEGFIKIIGYYPQISFDILPPQKKLDIAIFIIDPARDLATVDISPHQGSTACISRWAKLDPKTVPVAAKVAANYLNGMMARQEAAGRGFDYAIMLDTGGFIAEGGTESVFLVKEGRIMTSSLGTVLDSITRRSILQVSEAYGIESMEGQLSPQLLYEADEIFLSGTPAKALPVRQIEDRVIADTPGLVTREIDFLMERIVAGRDDRFRHWLYPVD